MDGQTDGLGLVGEGAFNGLLDPPGAVGGKFAAFGGVEALDGFHQTNVAFADEVKQRQADAFVIAGDFHHEPEVGFDHLLARFLVALFDAGGQLDFLLRGEKANLADFPQVELDGAVAVVAGTFALDEGSNQFGIRWNGNFGSVRAFRSLAFCTIWPWGETAGHAGDALRPLGFVTLRRLRLVVGKRFVLAAIDSLTRIGD